MEKCELNPPGDSQCPLQSEEQLPTLRLPSRDGGGARGPRAPPALDAKLRERHYF